MRLCLNPARQKSAVALDSARRTHHEFKVCGCGHSVLTRGVKSLVYLCVLLQAASRLGVAAGLPVRGGCSAGNWGQEGTVSPATHSADTLYLHNSSTQR